MRTLRRATESDVPFLVRCIRAAETGKTTETTYERLFGLSSSELEGLLTEICEADIPGCELCYPNFWIAEEDQIPAGGLAAWVEATEGLPSSFLKGQLLAQAMGKQRFLAARPKLEALAGVDILRSPGYLQLDAIFVEESFRGKGVLEALVGHILAQYGEVPVAQILLVGGNDRALRAYTRLGFALKDQTQTDDRATAELLGGSGRLLLEKHLAVEGKDALQF